MHPHMPEEAFNPPAGASQHLRPSQRSSTASDGVGNKPHG